MKFQSAFLLCILGLILLSERVGASVPPAGYRILNTSRAEYLLGQSEFISRSNQVETEVSPLYAISISPPGSVSNPAYSLEGAGGDTLYCSFVLKNSGNLRDSVKVTRSLVPPSDYVINKVIFFRDQNANNRFDWGEDDPGFLVLDMEQSVDLDVGIVLPLGLVAGDCYLEIDASSAFDPMESGDSSVVKATLQAASVQTLFIGPLGNPKATPGGEGSEDDITECVVADGVDRATFVNEVLNEAAALDVVEIGISGGGELPYGVTVAFRDSTGTPFPRSPVNTENFFLGVMDPGSKRKITVEVSSGGIPMAELIKNPFPLTIFACSLLDTLRLNSTLDRLLPQENIEPSAAISLGQTFEPSVAGLGDVVTLVVKVRNITDDVLIEDIAVTETIHPALDFLASDCFARRGDELLWRVGNLGAGEEKSASIKFICNGRLSRGKVVVFGTAQGTTQGGQRVRAGPVPAMIVIKNDIFAAEGVILGEFFRDDNGNGKRDGAEKGIAGISVYLDSGEFAVSDSLGRFSLPRAFSGYRVLRVDESTLPPGLGPGAGRPASIGRGGGWEWVVHLLDGGHAVLSFPLLEEEKPPEREPTVIRRIVCQEKVSIQKKSRVVYHTLSIPNSYFESGKAHLKKFPIESLREVYPFLASHPGWNVYLEGHTDSVPIHNARFPSNYELSVARAMAVKKFLIASGVTSERIFIRGHGQSRPVATNATAEGREKNRRVEVGMVPPGASLSDVATLKKVNASIENLVSLPETLQVKILWSISTDSRNKRDPKLSIKLPDRFVDERVSVLQGSVEVKRRGGAYPLVGFTRSSGVACEVVFLLAERDTSLIDQVELTMDFQESLAGSAGSSSGGLVTQGGGRILLHPFDGGRSTEETKVYELARWSEKEGDHGLALQGGDGVAVEGGPQGDAGIARYHGSIPGMSRGTDEGAGIDALGRVEDFAILSPDAGTVFSKRGRITVRASVPLGSHFELSCNGRAVPEKRIGERTIRLRERREVISWYGIRIRSGWNQIVLKASGLDGTERSESLRVALAGRPSVLECSRKRVFIPADGRTGATVRFAVRDHLGLPVVDGLVATVAGGDSFVVNRDERYDRRGIQISSRGGYFAVRVASSNVTGRRRVSLKLGELESSFDAVYVPPKRSLLLTGIAGARLGAINTSGAGDPFGLEDNYNGLKLEGSSRLFVQGTTYGGMNLTLRLDSRKRYEDEFAKSLDPELAYPIYGDASSLNFAAPSRGGNYVAVEKGESFARYGDFQTPLTEGEFLAYKRAATGINTAFVYKDRALRAFLTRTDFATFRDEIRSDGKSGYYYLSNSPLVENSEKVVLETRDRYQLEKVLALEPLVRNRDYTINTFDGALLFKEAVPVTDEGFNPVFIVVTYEVRTGDKRRYLYGLSGEVARGRKARLLVSTVAKEKDGKGYALYGARGGVAFGALSLSGEAARSEDGIAGGGSAFKVEAAYKGGLADNSLYLRRIDGNFLNPSFRGASHELASMKGGFSSKIRASGSFVVEASGYRQRFYKTGELRENLDGALKFEKGAWHLGAGLRGASQESNQVRKDALLSVLEAGFRGRAVFSSHWEKNLRDGEVENYPDRIKSSLSLPLLSRYRLALSHEYLTPRSRPASHQAQVGIESKIKGRGSVYTRYSMSRAADRERLGALFGLKQKVSVGKKLMATFNLENFHSLSRKGEEDYLALKTGLAASEGRAYVLEGCYEFRWQRKLRKHLYRFNSLKGFDNGAAIVLKNVFSYARSKAAEREVSFASRLGVAFRPNQSNIKVLFLLKNDYERLTPANPRAITWKLVFSSNVDIQPSLGYELRLKYALKRVEDWSYGISVTGRSMLVLSQFVLRFGESWDVDIWARFLDQGSAGTMGVGGGLEIGRLFFGCVRVGAGYSLGGFDDRDLSGGDAWAKGFGLRAHLILSNWLLDEIRF